MVKALPKLFLLFVFFCVSFVVNAQVTTIQLQTFTDEPVSHTFLSANTPAISMTPENGTITVEPTLPFTYEFTYTPDPGFNGPNESRILYFPLELPGFSLLRFEISVDPLILNANHDNATTLQGDPVMIDVLANDESSTGILSLASAPAVNGGTAELVGDQIVFTPDADFTGLTDFNYVVCAQNEGFDYCKTGTVSVNVLSNFGVAAQDTTKVFVKRTSVYGSGAYILAPDNYTLSAPPVNGVLDNSGTIPVYRPLPGHVGIEYLTYTNSSDDIVFEVETLDFVDNDFSVADRVYTSEDNPVSLNVLANDLYGGFAGCVSFDPPAFGTLEVGGSAGQVTYTPPAGWSGVDRFTYTSFPPGCPPGESETEEVTVVISNFRPAATSFSLTTASNVALPFTYEGPNDNVSWSLIDPPFLGTIEEDATTGQLTYLPNEDVTGNDFLSVRWCLEDADGECLETLDVGVSINVMGAGGDVADCQDGEDCVWPGDTNLDGLVDLSDLLPVGFYMGSAGTPRTSAEPGSWAPQESEDWDETDNGINRKHVDADGDQFVTALDTQVIVDNLGMVSSIHPDILPVADYEIILYGDIFGEPGDIAEIDVYLGTNYIGLEDVAGFIFPFNYDTSYIDASSVTIDYMEDSWLSYDSPVISVQNNDTIAGLLSSAYVRTSGVTTSGYGQVAKLYIGLEDVAGFRPEPGQTITHTTTVGGGMAESMTGGAHRSAVRVSPLDITIVQSAAPSQPGLSQSIESFLDEKLKTFPNPTSDRLTVHLNGQREFTDLKMIDLTGRVIENYRGTATNHRVLDLSAYPIGIYTLQITTAEGVISRKIEVIR
ncbi:hypothetical protein CEQ90_10860 [Lewinellaceae bacterium SD302]|nr:hypothetical protein CEQ90_10860 [Lewinellaceae bacterium SD302]